MQFMQVIIVNSILTRLLLESEWSQRPALRNRPSSLRRLETRIQHRDLVAQQRLKLIMSLKKEQQQDIIEHRKEVTPQTEVREMQQRLDGKWFPHTEKCRRKSILFALEPTLFNDASTTYRVLDAVAEYWWQCVPRRLPGGRDDWRVLLRQRQLKTSRRPQNCFEQSENRKTTMNCINQL